MHSLALCPLGYVQGASTRYLYIIIVNFGSPPSSGEMMAIFALAFYIALSLLAAWIEHVANTTIEAGLAR